jgi:hypothetical protein
MQNFLNILNLHFKFLEYPDWNCMYTDKKRRMKVSKYLGDGEWNCPYSENTQNFKYLGEFKVKKMIILYLISQELRGFFWPNQFQTKNLMQLYL